MRNVVFFLILSLAAASCSRKKDTFTSRLYHNTVTKYNPLFNGEQAYLKAVTAIEAGYNDDYSTLLRVKPYGNEALSNQAGPDLDKAIEKCIKVIQEHSMVIKNNQKNKYIDDAYLLMARSYFYKRDYFKAIEAFKYTAANFPRTDAHWHALLGSAIAQNEQGNIFSAELELQELYRNPRAPKEFKVDVPLAMAQVAIDKGDYTTAIGSLREALKLGLEKKRQARAYFILGQLHERLGQKYDAQEAFLKVISLKPEYNMLFQAKLNYARNSDIDLSNLPEVYAILDEMLRDDKNREFRDQILYVMSTVALIEEDFPKAEDFLKASLRVSEGNTLQQGLSYRRLGEINFAFKDYPPAAAYYDSAKGVFPKTHPEAPDVAKKADALDDLVANLNVVHTNDSLLALGLLPEETQRRAIDRYIEQLKAADEAERKRKEEEQAMAEAMAASEAGADRPSGGPGGLGGPPTPGLPGMGGGGGWYFYNTNTMSQGFSEFSRIWGKRKLEDQWRRSKKNAEEVVAMAASEGAGGEKEVSESQENADGGVAALDPRYDPNTYLAAIPKTEEDRLKMNNEILEALYQAGTLFRERFKKFMEAEEKFKDILKRYPEHTTTPRTYFALYRLYGEMPDEPKAAAMKSKLLEEYPESIFALALNEGGLQNTTPADEQYKKAYFLMKDKAYEESFALCMECIKERPMDPLSPKFALLSAECLGYQGKRDPFEKQLKWVIDQYPASPEAIEARKILDHLGTAGAPTEAYGFQELPDEPHRFVAVYPAKGSNANDIRRKVGNFTNTKYPGANLQVQNLFLDGDTQMMVVGEFGNALKAKAFYNAFLAEPGLSQAFPKGSVEFFYLANSQLKTVMAQKSVEDFLKYFNAKNP